MKLKSNFVLHKTGDESLMVSAGGNFNGMVRSNSTAAFVLDQLAAGCSREELIAKMLDVYDVDCERLTADIDAVLAKLREIGAIDE